MNHRLFLLAFLGTLLFFSAPIVYAQEEGSIRQAMSPEEFHRAGLDKLSDEELRSLDRWLQGDREKTAKKAASRTARTKMDLLVSRVDGSFNGLSGSTLIRLQDGTVWKQANKSDHYGASPVDNPGVAIFHSFFGYKMRIEGVPEFYVDQVRK